MEEVKDVAIDTEVVEKVNDGKVDMTREDSETSKDSSSEGTEGLDTSGKDGKTAVKDVSSEADQDDEVKDDGKPIPYERFKKVIEQKNKFKTDYESLNAENEGMSELLNNPLVFRAVLQGKGITDPKVLDQKMKEAGFEVEEELPKKELFKKLSEGLDLNTPEGWDEYIERRVQHAIKGALQPIEKKFSTDEANAWVASQEKEATKIAKEVYNLEYGVAGKDESNPNTAIGKIMAYLGKHPEHARLGQSTLIHLALAPEGAKLGEQAGIKKEKQRQIDLKHSAMEDDAQVVKDGQPDSSWSVSELMAWRRKHGK